MFQIGVLYMLFYLEIYMCNILNIPQYTFFFFNIKEVKFKKHKLMPTILEGQNTLSGLVIKES